MPIPTSGILALAIRSPAVWLGAVIGLTALCAWAYSTVFDRGVAHAERGHAAASAQIQVDASKNYLAALAWGNQISRDLAQTQRRLHETKSEYLAYAHAITGVCDPSVRMLVEYASGAKDPMPEASSPPTDGPFAEEALERAYQEAVARLIGVNVAENYSRLDLCIAEKRALNAWHAGSKEAVK